MLPEPPLHSPSEARRHLVVLFTDLSSSTWLSGAMEAETYAEMLDEVLGEFQSAVEACGGKLNQVQGDGLQAVFGYPQPGENDGRRAAEAALDMHQRVRALRPKYAAFGAALLSVHSGVHAGRTLARLSASVAGHVEIFGPAPGIAKHLSDMAEADEILVSEETLGPSSHLFRISQRQLVTLKGRDGPLAIHRVLATTALRTRFEAHSQRGLVRFVGRKSEFERLDHTLHEVMSGVSRFVALSGAPGLGKTRLAEEFLLLAEQRGCTVLRGHCEMDLSAEPLQPFLLMLRSRFHVVPGVAPSVVAQAVESGLDAIDPALQQYRPEFLQALSVATDSDESAEGLRLPPEQTLLALRNLVAALARRAPVVLFIDDWQWADDATRQVVHAVHQLTDLPVMLLTATRPIERGDVHLSAAKVLELTPLTDAEALATIGGMLPSADPFVVGEIRLHAGGNPLFIEELCHFTASGGSGTALASFHGGPAWLETLIESRVARLPEAQRAVLDAAAVIGNVVPAWLLLQLTGCGEAHPHVTELAEQDLLFRADAAGILRFKHGITRDVVYAAIGLQKRRATHRRLAELLAAPGAAAEVQACEALAYHCSGAADFAQAARHAEVAGDKAMAASSIDRAKAQYRAALDMLDRIAPAPDRYESWRSIVRRLGMASVFDPSRADLLLFERAVARARDHDDAAGGAYAEYWLAYVHYALGESSGAVAHCQNALLAAEGQGDQRLMLQARATLGQALAAAGDYTAALALLDNAAKHQDELRRSGGRTTPGLAYTLACKASLLGDRGCFDEAYACFDLALAALPGPGHEVEGSVLCLRSGVKLWQGRWEDGRADAMAARQVAERVRSLYLVGMSRALGGYADWKLHAQARALQDVLDATAWLQASDKHLFFSLNHGWLADMLAEAGRVDEARTHAARALRRVRRGDSLGVALALRAMGRLAIHRGDWHRAERYLEWAVRCTAGRGSAHEQANTQMVRAELTLAQGKHAAALGHLDQAQPAFAAMGMVWHESHAAVLRGRIPSHRGSVQ